MPSWVTQGAVRQLRAAGAAGSQLSVGVAIRNTVLHWSTSASLHKDLARVVIGFEMIAAGNVLCALQPVLWYLASLLGSGSYKRKLKGRTRNQESLCNAEQHFVLKAFDSVCQLGVVFRQLQDSLLYTWSVILDIVSTFTRIAVISGISIAARVTLVTQRITTLVVSILAAIVLAR